MLEPKRFDDLAKLLADSLPSRAKSMRHELEQNFQAVLQHALGRMDLVTREEFEVQQEVLARTRILLEKLTEQMTELEGRLAEK